MDIRALAEQFVRGVVEGEGFEFVHLEYQEKGNASVLRIFIDKPGGVNLADCQRVSRSVGVVLDVEDLIPHQYTLEVSSPGLERPLFSGADYERFKGSEVRVVTHDKMGDRRKFTGQLLGLSGTQVEMECEGEVIRLPLSNIKKAHLVYRFE